MNRLLIVASVLVSFSIHATPIKLTHEQIQNLGIKVGALQRITSVPLFDASARVIIPPNHDYIVSTLYSGLIQQIKVIEGEKVKKGQVLAVINSPELLKLEQQHLKSVSDLQLSKAEFLRNKQLFKEGIIANRLWLKTKMNHQIYQSYVDGTRQLLMAAGLSKRQIKILQNKYKISNQLRIRSPISGVVLDRKIKVGQKADALSPLFRVADLSQLWLDINIPQQRVHELNLGDRMTLLGGDIDAKIFLLGKNVDVETQTVLARAAIEGKSGDLRAGQVLSVKINKVNDTPMYQIPNTALIKSKGINYIFIKTDTGFTAQVVEVFSKHAQKLIIFGQLNNTDVIALNGAVVLKANLLGLGGAE
jgi:cobalt-zinc-cadmium efflux system membrane fusion protein